MKCKSVYAYAFISAMQNVTGICSWGWHFQNPFFKLFIYLFVCFSYLAYFNRGRKKTFLTCTLSFRLLIQRYIKQKNINLGSRASSMRLGKMRSTLVFYFSLFRTEKPSYKHKKKKHYQKVHRLGFPMCPMYLVWMWQSECQPYLSPNSMSEITLSAAGDWNFTSIWIKITPLTRGDI